MDKKYIFPYNIFLLGFLLGPVANQIELLQRYNLLFYFFRAILIACILWYLIKKRLYVKISPLLFMFLLAYNCFTFFKAPFVENPKLYMYVWDRTDEDYVKMFNIWYNEKEKKAAALNERKRKQRQDPFF